MIDALIQAIVHAYDSLLRTYGSPEIQLMIAGTLVALAAVELYLKRRARHTQEVA